jgi:hypothetical protein
MEGPFPSLYNLNRYGSPYTSTAIFSSRVSEVNFELKKTFGEVN